ncbi:MAG: hypothetical protein ABI472_06675 [Ginsengibacter sp.]
MCNKGLTVPVAAQSPAIARKKVCALYKNFAPATSLKGTDGCIKKLLKPFTN